MDAIEIVSLRKEYRRRRHRTVAVDGLDLAVPEGSVFGLLGPNGSGKTTTLRCLIGLASPTAGRCCVLGADCESELRRVIPRVGSVVEKPSFFPSFSARLNLELLAGLYGIGPHRVSAALERVGLAERADDIVRTYSLGMVQRLGLAAALLKDPALLILDEPANGLDPVGIVEVRDLLRGLAAEGRTVLVASHVLPEIEQACDHVAIFFSGRRVAMGTLAEVRAAAGTGGVLVRLAGLDRAAEVLRSAGMDSTRDGGRLRVGVPATEAARVSKILAEAGLYVEELQAAEASLEEAFFALTRGEIDGEVPR